MYFYSDKELTKGILQTIGFKEFMLYLEKFDVENDHRIEDYLRANNFKMPITTGKI